MMRTSLRVVSLKTRSLVAGGDRGWDGYGSTQRRSTQWRVTRAGEGGGRGSGGEADVSSMAGDGVVGAGG